MSCSTIELVMKTSKDVVDDEIPYNRMMYKSGYTQLRGVSRSYKETVQYEEWYEREMEKHRDMNIMDEHNSTEWGDVVTMSEDCVMEHIYHTLSLCDRTQQHTYDNASVIIDLLRHLDIEYIDDIDEFLTHNMNYLINTDGDIDVDGLWDMNEDDVICDGYYISKHMVAQNGS